MNADRCGIDARVTARPPLALPEATPLVPPADFRARLEAAGIMVESDAVLRLGDFLGRLLAMNQHMNLTSIVDPAVAWERHIFDALTLLPVLDGACSSLLDIGSGGGIPGIPIAIARPDIDVCLMEATQKKVIYLKAVSAALGLTRVSVVGARAEAVTESDLAGCFDVVTARAVARLNSLLPMTAPFARRGGKVVLIKGEKAEQELKEAKAMLRELGLTHSSTRKTATGRILVFRKS